MCCKKQLDPSNFRKLLLNTAGVEGGLLLSEGEMDESNLREALQQPIPKPELYTRRGVGPVASPPRAMLIDEDYDDHDDHRHRRSPSSPRRISTSSSTENADVSGTISSSATTTPSPFPRKRGRPRKYPRVDFEELAAASMGREDTPVSVAQINLVDKCDAEVLVVLFSLVMLTAVTYK